MDRKKTCVFLIPILAFSTEEGEEVGCLDFEHCDFGFLALVVELGINGKGKALAERYVQLIYPFGWSQNLWASSSVPSVIPVTFFFSWKRRCFL